jgi:hypothetical protein
VLVAPPVPLPLLLDWLQPETHMTTRIMKFLFSLMDGVPPVAFGMCKRQWHP